jgi:hypothetical protein
MAGKRDGMPMIERVRLSMADGSDCPARHCWVADAVDRSGHKGPGLLVEWRRAAAGPGWQGLVVYAAQLRPGGWAVVEEWVDESLLTPDLSRSPCRASAKKLSYCLPPSHRIKMSATHVELMATPTVKMTRPGRSRRFCIMDGTVGGHDHSCLGLRRHLYFR